MRSGQKDKLEMFGISSGGGGQCPSELSSLGEPDRMVSIPLGHSQSAGQNGPRDRNLGLREMKRIEF